MQNQLHLIHYFQVLAKNANLRAQIAKLKIRQKSSHEIFVRDLHWFLSKKFKNICFSFGTEIQLLSEIWVLLLPDMLNKTT